MTTANCLQYRGDRLGCEGYKLSGEDHRFSISIGKVKHTLPSS